MGWCRAARVRRLVAAASASFSASLLSCVPVWYSAAIIRSRELHSDESLEGVDCGGNKAESIIERLELPIDGLPLAADDFALLPDPWVEGTNRR